jgi:uncharacterized protein YyaL (SSP411 family)
MYKKILLLVMILVSSLIGDEVHWAKNFEEGLKTAQKQNKPILFISSRHSCKYCVMLDNTTLKDDKVIKALNRDFVSIVNYSDEGDITPKYLYRPGTPAIWFLLPSGEPMYQPIPGAIGAPDFLNAVAIVKEAFDKKSKKN